MTANKDQNECEHTQLRTHAPTRTHKHAYRPEVSSTKQKLMLERASHSSTRSSPSTHRRTPSSLVTMSLYSSEYRGCSSPVKRALHPSYLRG